MTDITSRYLEAAILDQKVAGRFRGKRYAFVAVMQDTHPDGTPWALGVAVENEDGYHPLDGKYFTTMEEAREWADGLNEHIGLRPIDMVEIITSTMRGNRANLFKWRD
jgi:hypothetical protein